MKLYLTALETPIIEKKVKFCPSLEPKDFFLLLKEVKCSGKNKEQVFKSQMETDMHFGKNHNVSECTGRSLSCV